MTNPTPHGQVPEALRLAKSLELCWGDSRLDEAAAELRRLHAYCRELEAQVILDCMTHVQKPTEIEHVPSDVSKNGAKVNMSTQQPAPATPPAEQTAITPETGNSVSAQGAAITSESGAVYAELPAPNLPRGGFPDLFTEGQMRDFADRTHALRMEQATKETSGGFHVWRDISTAPKDGSRFVATGHNYGLYSAGRHICVAQWFQGGWWMEASEWNESSELKYLTHWMPLPSPPDDVAAPAEQQASATEGYVQPVPDKCDRITWRGRYYHLPLIEQTAPKAAPVVWLSSKQLRGVTALHGQYLPFRCQPEGRFDTPVYLVEAAPKTAPRQEARHLTQALTDPENQPNQYGVEFGMSGQQMHFKIGNQLFRLAYEPDDQQEFEFMKRMLIHAFSTFTPDVKAAPVEPVHGDVLPPVGSRVYIRHGRDNDAHACTVTGYYAWGDLGGDKRLHRVFVRLVYEGTDRQQARMLCDCYPTAEAALAQAAPQQERCPSCINDDIYACTCPFPTSHNTAPQPAPACHHRPPCAECASLTAQGGK